jgi:multidrug efflux system membrane fusion protein
MTRSLFIAVVLAAIVGGWIVSGQIDALKVGNAATTPPAAPTTGASEVKTASEPVAIKVRGRRLTAQTHEREIVVRGRTEAVRQVTVRAETEGRVAEVVAAEGARVARGDLLVRLAVEERQAVLAEAEALARQRQIEYDAATNTWMPPRRPSSASKPRLATRSSEPPSTASSKSATSRSAPT